MAVKSSNVMARVEPDIKEQAEGVLSVLGLPVSVVINALYRQIILQNGIPFSLTIPAAPTARNALSKEEFDNMINTGLDQAKNGTGISLDDAISVMRTKVQ